MRRPRVAELLADCTERVEARPDVQPYRHRLAARSRRPSRPVKVSVVGATTARAAGGELDGGGLADAGAVTRAILFISKRTGGTSLKSEDRTGTLSHLILLTVPHTEAPPNSGSDPPPRRARQDDRDRGVLFAAADADRGAAPIHHGHRVRGHRPGRQAGRCRRPRPHYGAGQYLVASVDVPTTGHYIDASGPLSALVSSSTGDDRLAAARGAPVGTPAPPRAWRG